MDLIQTNFNEFYTKSSPSLSGGEVLVQIQPDSANLRWGTAQEELRVLSEKNEHVRVGDRPGGAQVAVRIWIVW